MINAIIFDLWSTLGGKHTSVSRKLLTHFNIPINKTTLLEYEKSVQLRRWKSMEQMAIGFLTSFHIPLNKKSIIVVKSAFRYAISHARPFNGILTLLKKLQGPYRLAILSNTTVFESIVISRWRIKRYFDCQVYSWQIGSLKPSHKNFEAVSNKLGYSVKQCLFVDDNPLNVLAARSLGMVAIHFQNVPQLRKQLLKLGIFSIKE